MQKQTARGILYITENVPSKLDKKEGYIFIKRTKYIDGKEYIYYTFPGGHVDKGEDFTDTVIREIKEELSIDVKVKKLALEMYNKNIQKEEKFYELEYVSGTIEEGTGEEFTNPCVEKYGRFEICIIAKENIDKYNILPLEVKEIINKK